MGIVFTCFYFRICSIYIQCFEEEEEEKKNHHIELDDVFLSLTKTRLQIQIESFCLVSNRDHDCILGQPCSLQSTEKYEESKIKKQTRD